MGHGIRASRCSTRGSLRTIEFICSLYMQRKLNPSKNLTKEEEDIALFAMHNNTNEEYVFLT